MKRFISCVMVFWSCHSMVSAIMVNTFENDEKEMSIDLNGPNLLAIVNITVPPDCHVMNATMDVKNVPMSGRFPFSPELLLNDTIIWAFSGTGYGALGQQDRFSNGTERSVFQFKTANETFNPSIRLPWPAEVENARFDVDASAPREFKELMNFHGQGSDDSFGRRVSTAGDVNGDGYDDIIIGAPNDDDTGNDAGRAHVFFGGPSINDTPGLILQCPSPSHHFGTSVSTAGDVNNDGYDDVIVGELSNPYSHAYIYYGSSDMNGVPDVIITSPFFGDQFGFSVANAGDVNGDGFKDVIVGAHGRYSMGGDTGAAELFFGGRPMDGAPDVSFWGKIPNERFGFSVSKAGDVNNDTHDDIIIGAYDYVNEKGPGRAYLFLGGNVVDNESDVVLTGESAGDWFGCDVSSAGDVNGDGFEDVIVGAYQDDIDGVDSGRAYLFQGGQPMDDRPDLIYPGTSAGDVFGLSVSPAGDLNEDGYDDIIIGASMSDINGIDSGSVYFYFGNDEPDNSSDHVFSGSRAGDRFGIEVSPASDINGDGAHELMIGAPGNDWNGSNSGSAYIYSLVSGILEPRIMMGSRPLWNGTGYFNGSCFSEDFSDALNEYLRAGSPDTTDPHGNQFVDVPLNVTAGSGGDLMLFNLLINYSYECTTSNFKDVLNDYIIDHHDGNGADETISVPIYLRALTEGRLMLENLRIELDGAPRLVRLIPDMVLDEDTLDPSILDLQDHFQDEYETPETLSFGVESRTFPDLVNVSVNGNRFISVDALTGSINDNWTGTVRVVLSCMDKNHFRTPSNPFNITIRNVNDPPLIISSPLSRTRLGDEYMDDVRAVDGDNDSLTFKLDSGPPNMTISSLGRISWIPGQPGLYNVSISVGDGKETVHQDFSIEVIDDGPMDNHPPRFISTPPTEARVGIQYEHVVLAVDDDGDEILYSLEMKPDFMTIHESSGEIRWIPASHQVGPHGIVIRADDGRSGITRQTFILTVNGTIPGPRSRCEISSPANGSKVEGKIDIRGTAAGGDLDIVDVRVRIDGGNWQLANGTSNWTLTLDTTKLKNGEHAIEARAFDGENHSETVLVVLIVDNPPPRPAGDVGMAWQVGALLGALLIAGLALVIKLEYRRR